MILDYKISKKLMPVGDKLYKDVIDYIKQYTEVKVTTKRVTDIKRCCYCLVINTAHAINKGVPYVGLTLDSNHYANPAIYNGNNTGRKISYRNMMIVLAYLENNTNTIIDRGCVTEWEFTIVGRDAKGDNIWKQSPSAFRSTRMYLDEDILAPISELASTCSVKESVLEVRDENGKPIGVRLTPKERHLINVLNAFNSSLDKGRINVQANRFYVALKKVYNNSSLKEGGRIFMTGANVSELLNRENRREIYINDIPTIELDYSQLWPRIAADLVGQELAPDFDVYAVEIEGYDPKVLRDLCKVGLMCLINADSFETAYYATLGELKTSGMQAKIDAAKSRGEWQEFPVIRKMLDLLMDRNAYLIDFFFSKRATFLMNIESSLMDFILERAVEDDRVLIPIHDSVVVQEDYVNIAEANMYKAYDVVVGGKNCVVRRK